MREVCWPLVCVPAPVDSTEVCVTGWAVLSHGEETP